MKLYFRELNREDIAGILKISNDIWEGEDYIPHVIEKWMTSKDSLNYGAFLDKNKMQLIGFGRVKLYPNGLAWLEGGRVSSTHQRRGIGRALMKYAVDYAEEVGSRIAQFDTSTENEGSISLAKFFGFKKKKEMSLVEVKRENLKVNRDDTSDYQEITLKEAKKIYRSIDVGPGNEVCVGWQFKPIEFLQESDGTWIINSGAILQAITRKKSGLSEVPLEDNNMWIIVYGKPTQARDLISTYINYHLKLGKYDVFEVFSSPETADLLLQMGFSYYEGEPFGVVLFEKHFKN